MLPNKGYAYDGGCYSILLSRFTGMISNLTQKVISISPGMERQPVFWVGKPCEARHDPKCNYF